MKQESVTIKAPNFQTALFKIVGTAPLVMNKFSAEAKEMMRAKQAAGGQAKKGKAREAKDFDACYEGAFHRSREGWPGMPCGALRAALISACRLVGFKMTLAKLALFIEADGYEKDEGTPLIRIEGEPHKAEHFVKNETGVADIRVRPMFDDWSAEVRVRYDADLFTAGDVANLLLRAGLQVGWGAGRPDSSASAGMGWGTFKIADEPDDAGKAKLRRPRSAG